MHIRTLWCLLPLWFSISSAFADESTAILNVTVTILSAPCIINNNQVIDIDFGSSIAVTDVASGTYQKPINYTLECNGGDTSPPLKMRISGNAVDFNTNELQTSIDNLAIAFEANGSPYALNSDINFVSADTKPQLNAILTQKPGSRLDTGSFTAGATMTVGYQ